MEPDSSETLEGVGTGRGVFPKAGDTVTLEVEHIGRIFNALGG